MVGLGREWQHCYHIHASSFITLPAARDPPTFSSGSPFVLTRPSLMSGELEAPPTDDQVIVPGGVAYIKELR